MRNIFGLREPCFDVLILFEFKTTPFKILLKSLSFAEYVINIQMVKIIIIFPDFEIENDIWN